MRTFKIYKKGSFYIFQKEKLSYFYWGTLILLFLISLYSIIAPFSFSHLISKILINFLSPRTLTVRIVYPPSNDAEREILNSFKKALETNKKIRVKEIQRDKNASTKEMLSKNRAELGIISMVLMEPNSQHIRSIAKGNEKIVYILTVKSYDIKEFAQLLNKKIGFYGDVEAGVFVLQKLIKFYNLRIPPELKTNITHDIDQAFNSGEIDALVWVDYEDSPELLMTIDKPWYQIVPIQKADMFAKSVTGVKSISLPHPEIYGEKIKTLSLITLLVCSKSTSPRIIPSILEAWTNTPTIIESNDSKELPITIMPPMHMNVHPIAVVFYNLNKPITQGTLLTICYTFTGLLLCSILLRKFLNIYHSWKTKHFLEELTKYQSELTSIRNQLRKNTNENELLTTVKRVKLIHQWIIQCLMKEKLDAKSLYPLMNQISTLLLEFNEKYFDHITREKELGEYHQVNKSKDITVSVKSENYTQSICESFDYSSPNSSLYLNKDEQLSLFDNDNNSVC